MQPVTIPSSLNGPPGSGHGGASAGLMAEASGVARPAVTLLAPPPLDVELRPHGTDEGVEFRNGDRPVARVTTRDPIPDPGLEWMDDEAVDGAVRAMRERIEPIHPFPTCFGCGHLRPHRDGLDLVAGLVPGTGVFATPWTHRHTSDATVVPPWRVWAAIDCPTGHACLPQIDDDEAIVLGRFAVDVLDDVPVSDAHQILVRPAGRDGRRIRSSAAVVDRAGRALAVADAVWVSIAR